MITWYFPLGGGRPPTSTDLRPPPASAAAAGDSAGGGATAHEVPSAIVTASTGFKAKKDHSGDYVRWNSGPNAKIMERALSNLDGNIGKVLLIVELGFLF
jgi:hypothetical protein